MYSLFILNTISSNIIIIVYIIIYCDKCKYNVLIFLNLNFIIVFKFHNAFTKICIGVAASIEYIKVRKYD